MLPLLLPSSYKWTKKGKATEDVLNMEHRALWHEILWDLVQNYIFCRNVNLRVNLILQKLRVQYITNLIDTRRGAICIKSLKELFNLELVAFP